MKLRVKKRGSSFIVVLPKQFIDFLKIEENDWIDMSDSFILKSKDLCDIKYEVEK